MISIGLYPSGTGKPDGYTEGETVGNYIVFDGPFYRACRDLLLSGFTIPWVLRYYSSTTQSAAIVEVYDEKNSPVKQIDPLFLKTYRDTKPIEEAL